MLVVIEPGAGRLRPSTTPPATTSVGGHSEACLKPELSKPYLGNNCDGELVSVNPAK